MRDEAVRVVFDLSGASSPENRGMRKVFETLIRSHSTDSRDHLLPNKGEGEDRAGSPLVPANGPKVLARARALKHRFALPPIIRSKR